MKTTMIDAMNDSKPTIAQPASYQDTKHHDTRTPPPNELTFNSNDEENNENEANDDVFGDERTHAIRYKTLGWRVVATLMVAEVVSNGMLSLPGSGGVVGLIPNVILIVFLGIFGTFTAYLLIQFKIHHPSVHSMGDAGLILFGPIGREVFSIGTIIFAICLTGGQLLAGQIAISTLSNSRLCLVVCTAIFTIPTLLASFPRTLSRLSYLAIPSVLSILVAGTLAMVAAGTHPVPGRTVSLFASPSFTNAFVAVTNPVFAYCGHFMFFILISEMRAPRDALKAAYALQLFATTYYVLFAVVTHVYLGDAVLSPSFSSLPPLWAKLAYGLALPNFWIAGSLYAHTAAKLLFVRIFRASRHLYSHTLIGWGSWTALVVVVNGAAFVLAIGVPIFSYLIGIASALFASWFTYGVAGLFWLFDAYYVGAKGEGRPWRAWMRRRGMLGLSLLTVAAGAFICVAGTYVIIKLIVDAYDSGAVPPPFQC